jgi:hypothetical protein
LKEKFPQISKLTQPLNRRFNHFKFNFDENVNRFNNSDIAYNVNASLHKGNKQEVMTELKSADASIKPFAEMIRKGR